MRKFIPIALSAAVAAVVIHAADWPTSSGNPQRDGWAKAEKAFTKENAGRIELLYTFKAENQSKSLTALTTPIINGMLITYLGFKEMLVFGGSQDNVYSVDADLNRRIWQTHFEYKADKPAAKPTPLCPGGLTASLAMPGSSTATGRGPGPAPGRGTGAGVGGRGPAPAAAAPPAAGRGPAPAAPPAPGRGGLFATGFGRSGVFLAIASDGRLHPLNTSTGEDKVPPVAFLPPNSKASGINVNDGVIYVATEDGCGGNPNAIYALDMSGEGTEHKLSTLETHGAGAAGSGGTAIGADGTVYAQIPAGTGDVAGAYNDTVLAMSKDLKVKDYFTPAGSGAAIAKDAEVPGITPVVFAWKGKDVIAAASRDGRVYLLSAESLGGADHHTPLAKSDAIASPDVKFAGNGFHGSFSSWEDENNTRWIYASLWGPPAASAHFGKTNGDAAHGSMVAFRVDEQDGKPVLNPVWVSRDLAAPAPPVTANGLVFALSSGESNREAKENGKPYSMAEREKMAQHATLYVLDGATGAELYSSGGTAASFSHDSGLTVANRRIYFTTHDNTVYALGFMADQPQLTGR
jgi:outer membrane protein assembly factor BamB